MRLSDAGLTLGHVDLGSIDAESDAGLADYFVTTGFVENVLSGRYTLMLGRKGSGKSAVFTQLERLYVEAGRELVLRRLTPDEYAWSAFRRYTEYGLLPQQAHTNAWKYTIAVEVAAAITSLEHIWPDVATGEAVGALRRFVADNYHGSVDLARSAGTLLRGLSELNLSALGIVSIGVKGSRPEPAPLTPAVISALFDLLERPLADVGVVVAFDKLDDSWDWSDEAKAVLIGLLKASKEINDRFGLTAEDTGLQVLSFLRSDIYNQLRFDDKDKHRPTEGHLTWTTDELRQMLAARLPSGVAVDELFESGDMRGRIKPFNYIVKRTFLRPREILQFVGLAIRVAGAGATEISKDAIQEAEARYSRWKVEDLKQEYGGELSLFSTVLECLRQEVHRYDALEDLAALLQTKVPDLAGRLGVRQLMELLFDASVIGVRLGDAGSARFRAEDADLVLPTSGAVYVHQSLYRGLNIRETRAEHE